MALYHFRLPDIGEGVAEAEIVVWHVKPGDAVQEDHSLVDVMTDKATVDLTSPVDGVVTAVHGNVGARMPVGSILVELEIAGEDATGEAPVSASTPPTPPPTPPHNGSPLREQPSPAPTPVAAPSTRRRAKEAGIDLRDVPTSHKTGQVTSRDLERYLNARSSSAEKPDRYQRRTAVHDIPIIGLRRKIAERMQEAKRRIPHISYVEEIDVTELEALRQEMNAHKTPDQPKLTLLPFFIRALVRALPKFPQFNARYDDEAGVLHAHDAVHVGIATQTPRGLMVPVMRNAECRELWSLAADLTRLATAARDGTARQEELSGSTITITSLGSLGGIVSTPVINHPEVAIIAPNKIVDRPIVNGNFVAVRKMMNLSSSFDHRIVDGYEAALFVQEIKRLIEHPALIFLD